MGDDRWDPAQYERFKQQRSAPFFELLELLDRDGASGGEVVDLGCGTAEHTATLHTRLGAGHTLGIDRSATMLAKAASTVEATPGLDVREQAIEDYAPERPLDVVFSNAALHFVDDHPALFSRMAGWLAPGGQLAIHLPANHGFHTHRVADEVAAEAPFAEALGGYQREVPVLTPRAYAELLASLGFEEPRVTLRVFPHVLPSAEDVFEWVKGSLLTEYEKRLPETLRASYVARYRERLLKRLPDERPFFFAFERILLHAIRR